MSEIFIQVSTYIQLHFEHKKKQNLKIRKFWVADPLNLAITASLKSRPRYSELVSSPQPRYSEVNNTADSIRALLHGAINCINTQLKLTKRAIDCSSLQFLVSQQVHKFIAQ